MVQLQSNHHRYGRSKLQLDFNQTINDIAPTVPQTAVPAVWDGHPTTQNANSNFNKIDGGIDSIMQNFGLNVFQWLILASYHHKSLNSWFFPEIIE
jgi:hypothetical protein